MRVIPVLDLLGGHAVRAVRGERSAYLPIQSSLCATSEPLAVARALLDATGADALYIADLGAILGHGAHVAVLGALCAALRARGGNPKIWLDAGYADFPSMLALFERIGIERARATLVPVFGTETLLDPGALAEAARAGFDPILSLDHRAGKPLVHPAAARSRPDALAWPPRVIAMTLDQVGAYEGPDLATFDAIRAEAGARAVIGAGGIRHAADLAAAAASGAPAWLVASALHDGRLDLRPAQNAGGDR